MIDVREYLDATGASPFGRWFAELNAPAAAKVTTAVARLEQGNTSTLKGIGAGVVELRIDFGPGYRVYLAWDGATVVILLAGGTKQRQQRDIEAAKSRWLDYKQRKKAAGG
jgi:putative addiction module killer protein